MLAGRDQDAVKLYRQPLPVMPQAREILYGTDSAWHCSLMVSWGLRRLGRYDKARALLAAHVKALGRGRRKRARSRNARIDAAQKHWNEAAAAVEKSLLTEKHPTILTEAYLMKGFLQEEMGNPTAALETWPRA